MTTQIANPTPKGSLVVVRRQHSYNSLIMGAYSGYIRFFPAIVSKASRTGAAKHVQKRSDTGSFGHTIDQNDTVMAVPAEKLNGKAPAAVLASMAEEYETLDECRAALLEAFAS